MLFCFIGVCQLNDQRPGGVHPALQVMQQHLQAVSLRDLESLAATLDPDGQM
jgi:hypothetical protein